MSQRLISREKLCEAIKISDSSLRKYVSRGVIVEESKGFIDLDNESNKICIIKYASKKGINGEQLLYSNISDSDAELEAFEYAEEKKGKSKKKLSHSELQTLKLNKEVEKLEVETRLKNLELEKKKAKVLPLDFIIDWSSLNIRGVFGETVNFGNSIIEEMCNEMDADITLKLKFKKKFKQGFNDILKDGIKNQKPEAIAQAKEYSLTTKW